MRRVLVTGAAGFIGHHVVERLLARGDVVHGVDSLAAGAYADLKAARLAQVTGHAGFAFTRADVADASACSALFDAFAPDAVIHLAARALVRQGLSDPDAYVTSNVVGFLNVLEGCRRRAIPLVYASSSSVYGRGAALPFAEREPCDEPLSLYAATKRSNELMAHAYAHLHGLAATGLRYFTVYGPWGRPDMAVYRWVDAILAGRPIALYNHGAMRRDFTYVGDVVTATLLALDHPPAPGPGLAPQRLLNVGSAQPVALTDLVAILEAELGRRAIVELAPHHASDVTDTAADVSALQAALGYVPTTSLAEGVARFVAWHKTFHPEAHRAAQAPARWA